MKINDIKLRNGEASFYYKGKPHTIKADTSPESLIVMDVRIYEEHKDVVFHRAFSIHTDKDVAARSTLIDFCNVTSISADIPDLSLTRTHKHPVIEVVTVIATIIILFVVLFLLAKSNMI